MASAYALDSVMIELIFVLGPLLTTVAVALVGSPVRARRVGGLRARPAPSRCWPGCAATATPSGPPRARARSGSERSRRPACRRSCSRRCRWASRSARSRSCSPRSATSRGLEGAGRGAARDLVAGERRGRPRLRRAARARARSRACTCASRSCYRPAARSCSRPAPRRRWRLLVILTGLPIAPLIASRNQLVERVAPRGTATEAFTWPLTALVRRRVARRGDGRLARRGVLVERRGRGRGGGVVARRARPARAPRHPERAAARRLT